MNLKTKKVGSSIPVDSSDIVVTYNGFLSTPDTNSLFVHMGYEDGSGNWQDIKNVEMFKNAENIYEATIPVKNRNAACFAFFNSNGIWDNNNGKNYTLAITERPSW